MKNLNKPVIAIVVLLLFGGILTNVHAKEAPPQIIAALIIKLAALEKNLGGGGQISIFVLGDKQVAGELKKIVGTKIGKATLKDVVLADELPTDKPSILYVGNASKLESAIKYTRSNKILSIAGNSDLNSKGVTMGIGVGNDDKPTVILNLSASKEEGLKWNPAIMKIAKTIK